MKGQDELRSLLELLPKVKYADLRRILQSDVEVALRKESLEATERKDDRVICRVLEKGYGVSSTDRVDREHLDEIMGSAVKQARAAESSQELAPIKSEEGEVEHPLGKAFDIDEARKALLYIRNYLKAKLGQLYSSSELILAHSKVDSSLATSEGTKVRESWNYTDITLYLVVRDMATGLASRIIGGQGGLEVIEGREWEKVLDDLALRARDGSKARMLSPLLRGRRFKVILDNEAAGALAHEIAHILEGDLARKTTFLNLTLSEDLEIVDNPEIPGAYGSFTWDDEGVRGKKKVTVREGEVNLLHTRLTAREGEAPGNAHGLNYMPRPGMSNVYISPSDWRVKEMFEETRSGIFVRGVVRAETDISDGRFELVPETAYLIENKEVKTPLKHLRIVDNIMALVQRIDAIGSLATLRPNFEKGFCISEGGPYVRLNDAHCS